MRASPPRCGDLGRSPGASDPSAGARPLEVARAPPDEGPSALPGAARAPTAFRPCGTTSRRRREPTQKRHLSLRRDLDANPNQIIFPRPNAGTVPSWRSDPQRVRFVGVSFQQRRRGYRSDAEVETQYRKLFRRVTSTRTASSRWKSCRRRFSIRVE